MVQRKKQQGHYEAFVGRLHNGGLCTQRQPEIAAIKAVTSKADLWGRGGGGGSACELLMIASIATVMLPMET